MLELIAVLALAGDESRFFGRREVDFWGTARRVEAPPAPELWPDSSAPPPVRRLLEAPSRENARAYLAWQKERMERLRGAMAALEGAKLEGAPLLYFARPGCPWCALQEKELEGLPALRVPEGSALWEEHAVRVTPTLVVRGKALRGFTPREAVLRELGRE